MNKVRLMLKNADSHHWESQGDRDFSTLPRAGDLVEVAGNDLSLLYRVVAVVHSQTAAKTAGEVYAIYIGPTGEVLEKLYKDIPVVKRSEENGTPIGFAPTIR